MTPSDVNASYEPFTGNFDGDNEDDVFWYRPGEGSDSIWFGNADRTFTSVGVSVGGTYKPAAGDLNQRRTSDVIWNRNWLADDPVWLFSPTTRADHTNTRTSFMVGNPKSGESAPFDGDSTVTGSATCFGTSRTERYAATRRLYSAPCSDTLAAAC